MKKSIIIQARLGSTRFPNKILKKVYKEKTVLEIIYRRLLKSSLTDDIIFAIPNNNENIKLKNFIKNKLKAKLFLGSEKNVINRYFMSSKKFKSDIIIRITADCPLVDPKIIDEYIDILIKEKLDYVYNGFPHTYPDGMDVEVFRFKALKTAHTKAKTKIQKEGVTKYFRDNLKKFKTKHIKCPINNVSSLRITIDEEVDLKLVRKIFDYFKPNINFNLSQIIELSKKNQPYLK